MCLISLIRQVVAGVPRVIAWSVLASMAVACGGNPPVGVAPDGRKAVWQLRSNLGVAAVRVVGETLQMQVTGVNADEKPVPLDLANLSFSSSDSTSVTVSPTGVIHLLQTTAPRTPIAIGANYVADNRFISTSVMMSITATRYQVDSISFAPDSTRTQAPRHVNMRLNARGPGGSAFPDLYVGMYAAPTDYSLDVSAWGNWVQFYGIGNHWIYGSLDAYGTQLRDSILFTIINKAAQAIRLVQSTIGSGLNTTGQGVETYIQPCGGIVWINTTKTPLAITFDTPNNTGTCGVGSTTPTGDIANIPAGGSATRIFPLASKTKWTAAYVSSPNEPLLSAYIVAK